MLSLMIQAVCEKAKRAIRLRGEPLNDGELWDVKHLSYNGVTVVWKNDYADGVFKIILRDHWVKPCVVIRERWFRRGSPSVELTQDLLLEEALQEVDKRLNLLLVLEDLANV